MRAAILALVVCALVVSLAYPLKRYLAQRSSIAALQRDNARAAAQVQALEKRKRELADPAYIETQARQRLQYVMPGEIPYIVVHKGQPRDAAAQRKITRLDRNAPWYAQLWESVRAADQAP